MRMLLTASIPTHTGNAAIRDGSLSVTMRHLLDILKPEAAYFLPDDTGNRGFFLIFDMESPAEIPVVCEPLFHGFDARVQLRPVMSADELAIGVEKAETERKEREAAAR